MREVLFKLDICQIQDPAAIGGELRMFFAGIYQDGVGERPRAFGPETPEHDRIRPWPPRCRGGSADDVSAQVIGMDGQILSEIGVA
jgi:hypothetical protein